MICVSVEDDFVLKQDICVMCGSLGNDLEGRLIACTQCGQCYHPHCVNIRVIINLHVHIRLIILLRKYIHSPNFCSYISGNDGYSPKRLEMFRLYCLWGLWRETRWSKSYFMWWMWHIIPYILFRSTFRSSASGYLEM